jgi:hypothetical protein
MKSGPEDPLFISTATPTLRRETSKATLRVVAHFGVLCMVRLEGLEPPHLSVPEPKSGASTNSATNALETISWCPVRDSNPRCGVPPYKRGAVAAEPTGRQLIVSIIIYN